MMDIVRALPDAYALVGRKIKGLSRLDVERSVPGVEVADGVGAVLRRGVGIGKDLLAEGGFAALAGFRLGEAEEELLNSGECSAVGAGHSGCGLSMK
jgi:hypothetical protein